MRKNLDEKKGSISYTDWLILLLIVGAVILRIYILYLPFNIFDYLVPPGDDAINHLKMVNQILDGNWRSDYPLIFHAIIAFISNWFSSDPLLTIKAVTPILVIFPPIGAYFFAIKHFKKTAALLTFLVFLLACDYALIAFGDGNYPNLLASGLFMPLALLFVVGAVKEKKWTNYLGIIVFTALILATHHLTAVLYAFIVVIYLLVIALWNKFEKVAPNNKKAVVFALIVFALGALAVLISPFRTMFNVAFASIAKSGAFTAGATFNQPIELSEYGSMIGGLVWYGGLISLVYLFFLLSHTKRANKPAIIMVVTWFFVAFLLSRIASVGLPGRFAREAAMPLVLSMGLVLSLLIAQSESRLGKISLYGLIAFIVLLNLSQINNGAYRAPGFFNQMIWFDREDKNKADYIKSVTGSDDVILANPTTPYLPIFTQRNINFVPLANAKTLEGFKGYITVSKAKYLFIGNVTAANPNGKTFPFFASFEETSKYLQQHINKLNQPRIKMFKEIYRFPDGSALYQIIPKPTATPSLKTKLLQATPTP